MRRGWGWGDPPGSEFTMTSTIVGHFWTAVSFPDVAQGIASVLHAVVWPGVVLFLAVRYRDQVGRLIDRLRKGGPAEFDPVLPPQPTVASSLPATQAVLGAVEQMRTPAVREIEAKIRALDVVTGVADPAHREAVLVTIAAKAVELGLFERTEANIYASQVELLSYLNARAHAESSEQIGRASCRERV